MNREDKAIGWHLNLAIRVNPPLTDDNELLDLIERLARQHTAASISPDHKTITIASTVYSPDVMTAIVGAVPAVLVVLEQGGYDGRVVHVDAMDEQAFMAKQSELTDPSAS